MNAARILSTTLLTVLVAFGPLVVKAQQSDQAEDSAQATTGQGSDFQSKMAGWIDGARESARSANARFEGLLDQIRNATDAEAAEEGLREMVEEAKRTAELYGEDSEIWEAHNELASFIEEQKEFALGKLQETNDERWQGQYDTWTDLGTKLQDVRVRILTEAVRARGLAQTAEDDLEFVLNKLLSDGVAAAIEEFEEVYKDIVELNSNLDSALREARSELVGSGG